MGQRGQTTSLKERVEIGERWTAGQNDAAIAAALERPLVTVRKWRRRYQRQGRSGLASQLGRPRKGALGQFSSQVVQAIDELRRAHPGWGPLTLLTELQRDERLSGKALPSRSRIAAYLKQHGLTRRYERHQKLPQPEPQTVARVHQEWEVDAQGKLQVAGLGGVSILLIADVISHLKIAGLACPNTTHPNTQDHQLAFRRGFVQYGLPELVSLDHDSVYFDNRCASPFPTILHLWLIGLGIEVRFIQQPPPAEHARIERGHQLVDQQAVRGQTFQTLTDFQAFLTARLDFLNRDLPSRSLHHQAPLSAFPQALQTQRPYRLEWEYDLLDLQPIYAYLAKGRWFRTSSSIGTFSLGAQHYNARTRFANRTIEITFDPHSVQFLCLPAGETQPFRVAARGLDKQTLMGELTPLLSIPAYQLALPFSRKQWRAILLCPDLPGTTF